MSEIKLKPCPFCGSDNVHLFPGYFPYADYIVCKNCKANFKTNTYLTDEQMAESWNKRAEPANVVHAHWESAEFDEELKTCSICHCDKNYSGTTWYYIRPEWRYCPHCGAIMDEVEDE